MIKTDTKQRYLEAIKDIRGLLLGPCPVNTVALLASEGIPTYLRRWALSGSFILDVHQDFQCILQGLDKVIEAYPQDPWLRVMRGRALIAIGWYMAAIQDLDAAMGADSAERCLFLAEAHFAQTRETFDEPLSCYTVAAIWATKSIQFERKDPRPYLLRAQCDAHIMKLCAYHIKTLPFIKKYKDIEEDLRAAQKLSDEVGQAEVARIAKNIGALLGIESSFPN